MRVVIQDHWDAYFEATAREAKAGAQVVLWPEISGVMFEPDEASFIGRAQEVAREHHGPAAERPWGFDIVTYERRPAP